jgi:hypothetical protein
VETELGQFINDTLHEASAAQPAAVEISPVGFGDVALPRIFVRKP